MRCVGCHAVKTIEMRDNKAIYAQKMDQIADPDFDWEEMLQAAVNPEIIRMYEGDQDENNFDNEDD